MRFRSDYVTNSSSSSFICCFAKIADEKKAEPILEQYSNKIEIYTGEEVCEEVKNSRSSWSRWLDWDWANVFCTPDEEDIDINSRYIVITDSDDIIEGEWGDTNYDVDYDDFDSDTREAIDSITKGNGFADIDIQYGAGRNG